LEAGALTSQAFASSLGIVGEYVVSLSVIFFGFSTIIAWFVYGAKCFDYLFGVKLMMLYAVIYVISTFIGTVADLRLVWAFADTANALMMIPNLIGILFLYKVIRQETEDYFKPSTKQFNS
ncbi:sodium:alanine symporter family protein, partial [Staphylococcus agnetis]|uniref:alanine:cation symporter family protein n=1 Tax=Staphylococcus agnetis TaxID=985762 RepID=UPI000D4C8B43